MIDYAEPSNSWNVIYVHELQSLFSYKFKTSLIQSQIQYVM